MKKIVILFFIVILSANAQEQPPIQNFSTLEYLGGNQNWSISQGDNKYIYVANNSGLLEYNGAEWKMYVTPNGSPTRVVKVIGDRVYAGYHMEMGFWKKDQFGVLVYNSLLDQLQKPLLEDEVFWNIIEFDDWVVFQTLNRLYIYNIQKKSFEIVDSTAKRALMFKVDGVLYYQKRDEGLFAIKNGNTQLVSDAEIILKSTIVGIYNKDKKILLLTEKGRFYYLSDNGMEEWSTQWQPEKELSIFNCLQLKNGNFALGTISNGLYIIDKNGGLIRNTNYENGLNNNTVLSLFQDRADNLWLGLDNGISLLNLNSQFKEYVDKKGTLGLVYTSIVKDGLFYLGTNQGLFAKPVNEDVKFSLLQNTKGQVWALKNIDGNLFCAHNTGTFLVEGYKVKLISDFAATWDIKKVPGRDELLLQGNHSGISFLHKEEGNWKFRNTVNGFNVSSRYVEFVDSQNLVVNNEFKGIYKLKFDADYTTILEDSLTPSFGFGSSIFKFKNRLLYANSSGVFEIKEKQQALFDSVLSSFFYNGKENITGQLTVDSKSEKIWGFTNDNIIFTTPVALDKEMKKVAISIPTTFRGQMGNIGFEHIAPLTNNTYFIGMSNGYVTLNLEETVVKEYQIDLTKVYQEFHNKDALGVSLEGNQEFDFNSYNISFQYSVPEFNKYSSVYYQFLLEGKYDEWSSWSQASKVSFENLSYGDYVFKVRGKVGNVPTSNEVTYNFSIKRPWYLSIVALLMYVFGFIAISFIVHRLYRNYYRRKEANLMQRNKKELKRKKLKAQKKIIQVNNEKLRTEIDSKNRELAISTMSIIKKNEFLNAIKDQLKQVPESQELKAVIRTIDRSINNEDDWKFFEEAFNNADKNFLKKVKNNHPDLTPNDLKLCAYLRLNLSSKEIAPLLNISLRSVEVKRYRLRKKMNLAREKSLTKYILDI